jgi:dienelactone hydrolase
VIKDFITALRLDEGATLPIGVAGFCWGGKYVVNLAHGTKTPDGQNNLIDAGFTAHPSLLKIPDEVEKIVLPVSFALPENDRAVKEPQIKQIQDIIASQPEAYQGEARVYYGAGHGFAVRADHTTKKVEERADEAEEQALTWFNRHLKR